MLANKKKEITLWNKPARLTINTDQLSPPNFITLHSHEPR